MSLDEVVAYAAGVREPPADTPPNEDVILSISSAGTQVAFRLAAYPRPGAP
jgi:hypothetical protein